MIEPHENISKTLIAITSANNLELTKKCINSIPLYFNILVADDASTEPVKEYCQERAIVFLEEQQPKGLTNLWNRIFNYFFDSKYEYLVISNNDVIFAKDSLEYLVNDFVFYNGKFVLVGPVTNKPGPYTYQTITNIISVYKNESDDPSEIDKTQGVLIHNNKEPNTIYIAKVSGFCFITDKRIKQIANSMNYVIPPHMVNVGNDDWLSNEVNLHFDNGTGVCRRSFVFHYKAMTTRWCKDGNRDTLWREDVNSSKTTMATPDYYHDVKGKTNVLCTASTAMGIGDGVMLIPTILELGKKYNVRIISTEPSYNILKTIENPPSIKCFNMNTQGHFYTNDFQHSFNLIYWDVFNRLRQYGHHSINMIRKCADLEPFVGELPSIPLPLEIEEKTKLFLQHLPKPVIITHPFMSYWNKMIENHKYLKIIEELYKLKGTIIQIGGAVPKEMCSKKGINLTGNTSLEQSMGLIKYADLFVGFDSFLNHAAAFMKTPSVTMFCGTSPEEFGYPYTINIFHPETSFCQTKCAR
jgi:hypothetical protein